MHCSVRNLFRCKSVNNFFKIGWDFTKLYQFNIKQIEICSFLAPHWAGAGAFSAFGRVVTDDSINNAERTQLVQGCLYAIPVAGLLIRCILTSTQSPYLGLISCRGVSFCPETEAYVSAICLPAHQLCCKQVLFLAASVCLSVRTKSRKCGDDWLEIDVT